MSGGANEGPPTKVDDVGAWSEFRRFRYNGYSSLLRFGKNQRGGFAVTFAVMAPALIVLLGLGLDYMNGLSHKSRWDSSVDAAALRANQTAEVYANANAASQPYSQLMQNAQAAGVAAGIAYFNANSGASSLTGSVTPLISISYSGTKFTTTASYTASIGSHFGGLLANNAINIRGNSTATGAMTTYINYYILVDISQSMGIGSTQTDMANLYNLTQSMGYTSLYEPGCVFGCHVAVPATRPLTNEQVAHQAGITLRIDAAKTAIQSVIGQAAADAVSGNIKIALYTMQLNPTTNSTSAINVASLSNSYASLTTAAQSIDLGTNNAGGTGDTDLVDTLQSFAKNVLPSNGTGLSSASPLNYVFVVTDGVMDLSGPCSPTGHCVGVIPDQTCSQLQQNATVGVIYTTYLPIYQNNNPSAGYDPDYQSLVLPIQSSIKPSLQSCASSSNYFFEANDGPALIAAMDQLFAKTQSGLRLIQ